MISTPFARPHRPPERDVGLLDLDVQQAARVIEYMREPA
jgi:hypothetical protein